jgi:hypothetical protein
MLQARNLMDVWLKESRTLNDDYNGAMAELKDFAGSVSIIVSSCDAFFDCWRPFAFFWRKFWPDCPFPVYLIVNEFEVRSSFIKPIRVGPDQGWATNMQRALAKITTPYVIYFQEDYFLTAPVQREQLAADLAVAVERDAAAFCFFGRTDLERDFQPLNERFGIVPQQSDGRTRCQATLWKRDVFAATLRAGETAWNMEARGSDRTRGLLALSYSRKDNGPIPYLMSAVSRGLWMPEAIALCREHNFCIRPAFRPHHADTKWERRWRRAVGRITFTLALARQRRAPIDLDQLD